MTEQLTFSSGDVQALAARLDDVTTGFDERERTLLVALLALAKEALDASRDGEVEGFGGPAISEIVVTKRMDSSSPGLFTSMLAPSPSKGAPPEKYLEIKMDQVTVTSVSW